MTSYTIIIQNGIEIGITCHTCHLTSYNQNDVVNKYCGYCHEFLDFPMDTITEGEQAMIIACDLMELGAIDMAWKVLEAQRVKNINPLEKLVWRNKGGR